MVEASEAVSCVVDLLTLLKREGDTWHKNHIGTTDWRRRELDRILSDLRISRFTDDDDLRRTVRKCAENLQRSNKCVVLEPWNKAGDCLFLLEPAFALSADKKKRKLVFHVGIVLQAADDKKFFGYRYEGPEGASMHDFYHAQPIKGFDKDQQLQSAISWYPTKYPTFPLAAKNDCELLLVVILAFQGMDKIRHFESQSTRPEIRKHAAALVKNLKSN